MAATLIEPGTMLGNYQLVLELASGGMATVFAARHMAAAGFERLVVIKRVHPHLLVNREFYDMFLDEARVAALIRHPNVVAVTDVVEQERELFLVMEYCESHALSTLLKTARARANQPLPLPVVVRIFADMLAGLHAAHQATDMLGQPLNVVHRDVSPQNVIVGVDGVSRLIDFGVAKAERRLSETRSGSLKGKLAYMAPEQASGAPVDRRADLFAAGAMLHEALTGTRLFRGENEAETITRLLHEPVPAPSAVEPSVPAALDAVTLKALSRNALTRFQTAAEFLEALEQAAPAASAREVSECLDELCGERTRARRVELQEKLDSLSRVTEANPIPGLGAGRLALFAGAGAFALAGLVAGGWWLLRAEPTAAAAPDAAIALAAPALPDAAAALPDAATSSPDGAVAETILLTFTASSRIASVRTTGLAWAGIDGNSARIAVQPWEGDLPVEATLENGRTVRLSVSASGPRELRLEPGGAPDAASRHPEDHHPHPSSPSDLHENPYGEQ